MLLAAARACVTVRTAGSPVFLLLKGQLGRLPLRVTPDSFLNEAGPRL